MRNLLVGADVFSNKTADLGYEYLSFQIRALAKEERFSSHTDGNELAIVVLGGKCSTECAHGDWPQLGQRSNVFGGLPYTLYLPPGTEFELTAKSSCELALCYCRAEDVYPPRLISPSDVEVEIRGGGNATRQIHHIIKPEFPAHRIMVVEVFTPSGNWSSYPPHKHDVHAPPGEVDLEEIYYFRIDRAEGYAIQKVYTADRRIDETLTVRDGELVLVQEGYHPVVAAHGYNAYYLNALAGSARSMAASDDPNYAWVRGAWKDKDPRLPLVRHESALELENQVRQRVPPERDE